MGIIEPLKQADLDGWTADATEFAGDRNKASIVARFARLRAGFQTPEQDAADSAKWDQLASLSTVLDPTNAQHRRRLASILGDLACGPDGAPYIARVLEGNPWSIGRGQGALWEVLSDRRDGVVERLRSARESPQICPGVSGFTQNDWDRLKPITRAPPAPGGH
jgi:hypothetical protein